MKFLLALLPPLIVTTALAQPPGIRRIRNLYDALFRRKFGERFIAASLGAAIELP